MPTTCSSPTNSIGTAPQKRARLPMRFTSAMVRCRRLIKRASIQPCPDYFKAVAATNSTETAMVLGWMRANPVDEFFAQGSKNREDGRMVHDMYLMRIKKPEESKSTWDVYEYLDTIPGDQAFRPMAEGGCRLVRE